MFEGLGLGSRVISLYWGRKWIPYLLVALYVFITPFFIAVGIGIYESFQPGSSDSLIISGVMDALSAGILLYTGVVELMARDFLMGDTIKNSSLIHLIESLVFMVFGAGIMALLGFWA